VNVDDARHTNVSVGRRVAHAHERPPESEAKSGGRSKGEQGQEKRLEDPNRPRSLRFPHGLAPSPNPGSGDGGALYLRTKLRRASTLSVRSHENSGSLRPKWP
jgi:hypothetical protein